MKLTLGFSPCPNDTFIFDAMINKRIDTRGIDFDYFLEDVEKLNVWATRGKLDITKLSFNTFLHTVSKYALLNSGSALGKGVGPLLIAKQDINIADLDKIKVAIPGVNTTANLLLALAFPNLKDKTELRFDKIEDAVLAGKYDAGLIIHESRFTYQSKNLIKLMDLGEWWENTTGSLIPLGGIVISRKIDKKICSVVDSIILESINYAWNQYPLLTKFVTENAQEMEEDIMRKHIQLYVNEYTNNIGVDGKDAINTLFLKAEEVKLIHKFTGNIFF